MKTILTTLCLLFSLYTLTAQCTINPSLLTTPGVYPAAEDLPCITPGQFYDVTLQGKIDTVFDSSVFGMPSQAIIDSIQFDSIAGMPDGIFMSQSPLVLKGGENGCIRFSGVTNNAPAQFLLTAYGKAWTRVSIPGTGVTDTPYMYIGVLNDYSPFGGYYLTVCDYGVELGANTQTACTGSTLTFNPVVTGGTAPYTYAWSAAGSSLSCTNCKNPQVTITQASSYSVTVIDANNNSVSDQVAYSLSGGTNTMQLAVTSTGIDCLHPTDTTVVTPTGGTPSYTFLFGDGNSTASAGAGQNFYAQPGTYVVAVTDAAGCSSSILNNVTYNGIFVSAAQTIKPTCIYSNNGSITATATNGTGPYNYVWSNGAVTAAINNLGAGNYTVTVTDAAFCSAVQNFSLAPANGWGYYTYLTPSVSMCNNNGSVVNTPHGGTPPYTYIWNNSANTQNITGVGGGVYNVTVTDALGCTTTATTSVPTDCYSTISGKVFVDANANCVYDAGDSIPAQILIAATGNSQIFYGTTLPDGSYSVEVPSAGTYTLNALFYGFMSGNCAQISLCNNPNNTVTIATLGDSSVNNYFTYQVTTGFNLSVFPRWGAGNPGFTKTYRLSPFNISPIAFNGQATVTFTYDTNLIFQTSNTSVSHNLAAHKLTWLVDSINQAYFFSMNEITAEFLVPVGLSLSTMLTADFRIDPTAGDCDTTNNRITTTDPVTGSFDPNEKKVQPAGNILEEDSVLTYTIGFQNTGTDSTHFIILKDTLSAHLDVTSVRNIAASHPYTDFSISGESVLTWTFNPLRLVDSFTNEPESHGFVKFTVKKKPNLPIGTIISNKAYIYFDYNEPVITNTVTNELSLPNGLFTMADNGIQVKAFPNPFTNATRIQVTGLSTLFHFELYDVTGRLRKRIANVNTNQLDVERGELIAGVYFYRIVTVSGQSANGKLVVE